MRNSSFSLVSSASVLLVTLVAAAGCSDVTHPRPPATGALRVSIVTRGEDLDPDGYNVRVDAKGVHIVASNDFLALPELPVGKHTIGLEGLAMNCVSESGRFLEVEVPADRETEVAFVVACVARIGSIDVSASTAGVDLAPAAYTVRVDTGIAQTLGVNGIVTLSNVREGAHAITLSGIGDDCRVIGANPRYVDVSFRGLASIRFDVKCALMTRLQITTSSSGADVDPDGYTLEFVTDGFTQSVALPSNGTLTTPLFAGAYSVTMRGISANCMPKGDVARQIELMPSAQNAVSLEVDCAPATQLAIVRDGHIYVVKSNGADLVQLVSGDEPAWSPDGRRIAFVRRREGAPDWTAGDVYVIDADGSNERRIISSADAPAWAPDSRRLAFSAYRDGQGGIYIVSVDDDGKPPLRVGFDRGFNGWPAWSPDGSKIAFVSDWTAFDFALEIFVVDADGSHVEQLTDGFFGNVKMWPSYMQYTQPAWSPDGKRIAVVTCSAWQYDTCGSSGVAIMNADGSNLVTLATSNGYARPTWSPDGRAIALAKPPAVFFVTVDGKNEGQIVSNGSSPSWRR